MFRSCAPRALVLTQLAVAVARLTTWPTPAAAQPLGAAVEEEQTARYIVVFQPSVANAQTAAIRDIAQYGVEVEGVYQHSIKGYTASMLLVSSARRWGRRVTGGRGGCGCGVGAGVW
jgi:hypothetical protein